MTRNLIFEVSFYDASPLVDSTMDFFVDYPKESADSISKLSEQELVKWIFGHPCKLTQKFFNRIFPYSKNDVCWELEVQDPILTFDQRKRIGDIDAILWEKNEPHKAIAIQFKKLKIVSKENHTTSINRLMEIDPGIEQANLTKSFGFYKTFFIPIITIDSRYIKGDALHKRPYDHKIEQIYDVSNSKIINQDVGIIYFLINQVTGKHYNQRLNFGFCLDKTATAISQNVEITNKIRDLESYRH